jgi:hypothetical protein
VAHFGTTSYRYGKIEHPPNPYPNNPAIDFIMESLSEHLKDPDFNKTYGCLITKYSDGRDNLAFHSDNEESIVPGSNIITVSLGHERPLVFQNIVGPLSHRQTHPLKHGSVHSMSHFSQGFWAHSIPPADAICGPRVSLTFRKLRDVPRAPSIPPICQPEPSPPTHSPGSDDAHNNNPTPKRLLFLSDSIHLAFPTEMFEHPDKLVCIKKQLFQLNKLDIYENEFAYSDYVFISCGINDLSRYSWEVRELFDCTRAKLNRYRVKYPDTTFIFNSLLTTNCGDWLNVKVNQLNHDMFQLSLASKFLWFFDSHHVARKLNMRSNVHIIDDTRNGIHITHRARREIWHVFCRCINVRTDGGDISKIWPLREAFRRFASRARRG